MIERPDRALVRGLAWLAALSLPLHLAWEWVQCAPYFIHRAGTANPSAMLLATLGDLVLTGLAHALMSAVHGPYWFLRRWSPGIWLGLLGLALLMSLTVETLALRTGRWTYTDAAPLIPGTAVSVLPVAQLLLLFPLSFGLAQRLARQGKAPSAARFDP